MHEITRLYHDTIRQHAAHPVGYRLEIGPTHQHEAFNPQCGDRILMRLRINGAQLEAAAFDGEACTICMASASLLCDNAPGYPVSRLIELHDRLHAALASDGASDLNSDDFEVLRPLQGVKPFPARISCATLPWMAARQALGRLLTKI